MGSDGAVCFHTLTNEAREVPKAQWDEERFGQLCMTAAAYGEFKSALLRLCRVSRRCTYAEQEDIRRLGNNLNQFKSRMSEGKE